MVSVLLCLFQNNLNVLQHHSMSGEERTPNRTDNRTFVITFSIVISEEFVNNIIADKKSARPTEITIQFRLKQESGQLSDGSLKVRSFFGITLSPHTSGIRFYQHHNPFSEHRICGRIWGI